MFYKKICEKVLTMELLGSPNIVIKANKSSALAVTLAFAVLFSFVLPAWAQEAPVVNVIEIRGLMRIDKSSVRAKISHDLGEPLNSEKVTVDIQEIYKLGYFDDVRVEVEPFEGGVRLLYIVREKPVISRVDFQGNKKLKDEKLREQLTISPGSIADTGLIQQNAEILRALYASKGYSLAEVVPVVRRAGETQAVLTYQIDEGHKVKIKKVIIEGNKKISKRKIKNVMKTGKWWLLSALINKGYYEKMKLDADIRRIRDLYYDHGYIQVSVEEPKIEFTKDRKKLVITIRISEGEQFKISSIGFTGNSAFTEEDLRDELKSEAGKIFSKGKLQDDIEKFTEMYGLKGYAATTVLPDVVPDETAKDVALTYNINEGDVYTVGKVYISGNYRTRDKVIRREVRLNEGDLYNSKLLKRSYERILNTNYFGEVKFLPRIKHREKEVDIDIDVKEKKTGAVSIGAGYSTIDRLLGMVEFSQSNFRGAGQRLNVKAELGSVASNYSLSFVEPWFLDRPVSFSTSIYNTEREFVNYNRKATGFSVGLGKEIAEYWYGSVTYSLEEAEINDIGTNVSTVILDQAGKKITSSIALGITRDTRDNHLDPHTGSKNTATVKYAGLGGDNNFLKYKLNMQKFFPVSEKTTLVFRGRYGSVKGLKGKEVPLYERFYVGGIYTIRGLDFGEGGPRDETGAVIGGLNMAVFNTEFIFPLYESLKLKGVIFFDAGLAYDDNLKLDEVRYTAGAGVRWLSPIGPIRLEWGKNLEPKLGEADSKWEFAMGTFF
jgi:outer membrane protein insertion porin family